MRTKLVYLVEDDEDDRHLMETIFADFFGEYDLRLFEHGAHLLTHLTHRLDGRLPDLVVMDLSMPILNGFDTLQYLKSNPDYKLIPTLILTSSQQANDINRCYELGSNAFMTKPRTYVQWVGLIGRLQNFWLEVTRTPIGYLTH